MSRSRPRRSKQHRQPVQGSRCPTPRKLAWSTRESAEDALTYFTYRDAPKRAVRVYLCPGCKQFHHTSKPGD